jgi:hypothetical protein
MSTRSTIVAKRSKRGIAESALTVAMNPKKGIYINPYRERTKSIRLKTNTAAKKMKIIPSTPRIEYETNRHRGIIFRFFVFSVSKIVCLIVMVDSG